jgi:AbrB family looped-hinge helix DNA binding protein
MRTTIDGAGRLVIPAGARSALGLRPGQELEVRVVDAWIEIEPVGVPVHVEEADDGLPVLVADGPVEQSTVEDVRAAVEQDREERMRRWD